MSENNILFNCIPNNLARCMYESGFYSRYVIYSNVYPKIKGNGFMIELAGYRKNFYYCHGEKQKGFNEYQLIGRSIKEVLDIFHGHRFMWFPYKDD